MPVRSVCVFCGASIGANPAYREAAIALGQAIARRGLTLVYGGGAVGLMGTVADAAMAAGGEVIGIIPESLMNAEIGHKGLSRLEVVDGMHARKARMAELGPIGLSRQAAGAAGCERLLREAGRVPRPYRRRRLRAAAASGDVAAGAAA
ncbi:LOG family protein YvdD [compost metagenome]